MGVCFGLLIVVDALKFVVVGLVRVVVYGGEREFMCSDVVSVRFEGSVLVKGVGMVGKCLVILLVLLCVVFLCDVCRLVVSDVELDLRGRVGCGRVVFIRLVMLCGVVFVRLLTVVTALSVVRSMCVVLWGVGSSVSGVGGVVRELWYALGTRIKGRGFLAVVFGCVLNFLIR